MDKNMFDLGLDVATILAELPDPVITLTGADSYTVQDTADHPLLALSVYGKSVQDGTPTPDAPIDIVSVGDDGVVNIVSHGKNIFDFETWKSGISTIVNGTVEYFGGGFKLTATAADCFTAPAKDANYNIPVEPNTTYTLGWISDNQNQGITYVFLNGKVESELITSNNSWPSKQLTFTSKPDTTFIRVRFGVSHAGNSITYSNIQLEKGDVKTEYEPFEGYNTAAITSGLPLCSVDSVKDELIYNADGTGKIIKRTAKIVLDGSNDEAWQISDGNAPFQIRLEDGSLWESRLDLPRLYCSKYERVPQGSMWGSYDYMVSTDTNGTLLAIRDISVTTLEEFKATLNAVPMAVVYVLATPQEIELSSAEMAELQKLQSYEGTTSIYNDEQAEMLIKLLRSDYDMKYIEWLKESQTWTCPKAGKWKVICVGGGASGGSGGDAVVPTTAGGTTSFGSIVSASGAPSTKDYIKTSSPIDNVWVGAYGGYTGVSYGGTPAMAMNAGDNFGVSGAHTNGTLPSNFNPVCGIGYGAGGASAAQKAPIPGRAGSIESTIVDLEEGQVIMCTVGKGGQTTDATTMSSGADGVIVVQYLGY